MDRGRIGKLRFGRVASRRAGRTIVSAGSVLLFLGIALLATAPAALAHEGEENIKAFTDVQEAIALLAAHPNALDIVMDKVHDALESEDQSGVNPRLLRQADRALEAGDTQRGEILLEQSIGVCPGQPVVEPADIPRTPLPLDSPCPNVPHIEGIGSKPIGGVAEPVLLAAAGVVLVGGLALLRLIHR